MTTGDERGQSTVELALCLPVLVLLLAAVVEIAMLAGDQVRLWDAAREAARIAVVDADTDAIRAAAERKGLSGVTVAVEPRAAYRVQGRPLTVSLSYSPSSGLPLLGEIFSGLELRSRASMRIEQP